MSTSSPSRRTTTSQTHLIASSLRLSSSSSAGIAAAGTPGRRGREPSRPRRPSPALRLGGWMLELPADQGDDAGDRAGRIGRSEELVDAVESSSCQEMSGRVDRRPTTGRVEALPRSRTRWRSWSDGGSRGFSPVPSRRVLPAQIGTRSACAVSSPARGEELRGIPCQPPATIVR